MARAGATIGRRERARGWGNECEPPVDHDPRGGAARRRLRPDRGPVAEPRSGRRSSSRWARSPAGRAASDRATPATTASRAGSSQGRFVVTAADRPTLHQAARNDARRLGPLDDDHRAGRGGSDVRISLEYELPGEILGNLFRVLTGAGVQRVFHRTYSESRSQSRRRRRHERSAVADRRRPGTGGLRRGRIARGGAGGRGANNRDPGPLAGRARRRCRSRQVDVRRPPFRPGRCPVVRCIPGAPERRRGRSARGPGRSSRSSIARS